MSDGNTDQVVNTDLTKGGTPEDIGQSSGFVDYNLYLDKKQPIATLKSIAGKVAVFNQMKNNSTISGILLAFKSLCQTPKLVVNMNPQDPDQERAKARADFLTSCLSDMQTPESDVRSEILDMIEMGFKVMVPQFKARTGYDKSQSFNSRYNDGKIGWKNFTPIDPASISKWNSPENTGYLGLTGITQVRTSGSDVKIPRNRMLIFRTTASNNDPTGKSILEGAYLDWVDLVDANKIQMVGLRRCLEGIPYARVHSKLAAQAQSDAGAEAAVSSVKNAVRSIDNREDTAFVLPADRDENGHLLSEVRIMGSSDGGGNSKIQDAKIIIDSKEHAIARSMLAQFMTIQGKGGSYALSKNQSEVFINSLKGYLSQIEGIFNQEAIPRLFAVNGEGLGDDHYLPTITYSEFIRDDVDEFFTGMQKAIEVGIFEPTEQIQKKAGQVLGIDISGQDTLLKERRERLTAMQQQGADVVGGDSELDTQDTNDIPETTKDDIIDPVMKGIISGGE